ncbi:class II aldolase/adducin family protein, partial [Sinomonas humi]
VPWGPRGSDASTRGIEQALALQPTTRAVLMGNHGLLAFGPDPLATAALVTAIEESAQSEIAAAPLGGAHDFPQGALEAVRESMARAQH